MTGHKITDDDPTKTSARLTDPVTAPTVLQPELHSTLSATQRGPAYPVHADVPALLHIPDGDSGFFQSALEAKAAAQIETHHVRPRPGTLRLLPGWRPARQREADH